MGSLMAGWDSHVSDPKDVKLRRNNSLTKEEIDAFWRSKRQKEEEHLRDISVLSPRSQIQKENVFEDANKRSQRSISVPLPPNTADEELNIDSEPSLEKLIQKNGWWISSNWAFLNEPPVITTEGPKYNYAAQHHVADIASRKSNAQTGVGT